MRERVSSWLKSKSKRFMVRGIAILTLVCFCITTTVATAYAQAITGETNIGTAFTTLVSWIFDRPYMDSKDPTVGVGSNGVNTGTYNMKIADPATNPARNIGGNAGGVSQGKQWSLLGVPISDGTLTGNSMTGSQGNVKLSDLANGEEIDSNTGNRESFIEGIDITDSSLRLAKGKEHGLQLVFTPGDSSTSNVKWTSSNSNIASVSSSGVVKGITVGTTVITASVVDGKYTAICDVEVYSPITSLEWVNEDQINVNPCKGESQDLRVKIGPEDITEDPTVEWTTSNNSVLTVDQQGHVEAIGAGTATITARVGELEISKDFGVEVDLTSLGLDESYEIPQGSVTPIVANLTPADATTELKWSILDTEIATVDSHGNVHGIKIGNTTIQVQTKDGKFSASAVLKVIKPVDSVSLNKSEIELIKDIYEEEQLIATVLPSDATNPNVTWESTDEEVAHVDGAGKVLLMGGGECEITATAGNKTARCKVIAKVPVTGVVIYGAEERLPLGRNEYLYAQIFPDKPNNPDVVWESSNPSVATVDQSGKVVSKSIGFTKITVTTSEGNFSDSKDIEVYIPVNSLELNTTEVTIHKGDTYQLSAIVDPDNATYKEVAWESYDPQIVSVDSTGKVTGVGGGIVIVQATTDRGDISAECIINVVVPVTGVQIMESKYTISKGESMTVSPVINPDDSTDSEVSWESSDDAVATVDKYGTVYGLKVGSAVITVTTHDGGFTAQCDIDVLIPVEGIELDKSDLLMNKGDTAKLIASIFPEDATDPALEWSSSDTDVVTVDGDGNISAVGAGFALIVVTTHDGGYIAMCLVDVEVPLVSIQFVESNVNMILGEMALLRVWLDPVDATNASLTWTSSDPNIISVDSDGFVTANAIGSVVITASACEGSISASCNVTVKPDMYSLTVVSGAHGISSGTGMYAYGSTAIATATPDAGYRFAGWSDGNTCNPRSIYMDRDRYVTAFFKKSDAPYEVGDAYNFGTYSWTIVAKDQFGQLTLMSSDKVKIDYLSEGEGLSCDNIENYINSTVYSKLTTLEKSLVIPQQTNFSSSHTVENIWTASASQLYGAGDRILTTGKVENIPADGDQFELFTVHGPEDVMNLRGSEDYAWLRTKAAQTGSYYFVATTEALGYTQSYKSQHYDSMGAWVDTDPGQAYACVKINPNPIQSISIVNDGLTVKETRTMQFGIIYNPANYTGDGAITWSSSNNLTATVSSSGVITGIKVGECVISARTPNGKSAALAIQVLPNEVMPTAPTRLDMDYDRPGIVTVSWKPPSSAQPGNEFTYNVYVDGRLKASTSDLSYSYTISPGSSSSHTEKDKEDPNDYWVYVYKYYNSKQSVAVEAVNAIGTGPKSSLTQYCVKEVETDTHTMKMGAIKYLVKLDDDCEYSGGIREEGYIATCWGDDWYDLEDASNWEDYCSWDVGDWGVFQYNGDPSNDDYGYLMTGQVQKITHNKETLEDVWEGDDYYTSDDKVKWED